MAEFRIDCTSLQWPTVGKAKLIYKRHPKLKEFKNVVMRNDELYFITENLDDILELKKQLNEEIIITSLYNNSTRSYEHDDLIIEIYDSFRE